jgi:hypothetical protein
MVEIPSGKKKGNSQRRLEKTGKKGRGGVAHRKSANGNAQRACRDGAGVSREEGGQKARRLLARIEAAALGEQRRARVEG